MVSQLASTMRKYMKSIILEANEQEIITVFYENFLSTGRTSVRQNGLIDVTLAVNIRKGHILHQLPVSFGNVGSFSADSCELSSLKGCPQTVGHNFSIAYNWLKSLEHGPQIVGKDYDCSHNQLETLQGAPREVNYFDCSFNELSSLDGAPDRIGFDLVCISNPLKSLSGLPRSISGTVLLSYSRELPLLRLVGRSFSFALGVNKTSARVADIIKKYDAKNIRADIIACQKELIDAGFEGNASW